MVAPVSSGVVDELIGIVVIGDVVVVVVVGPIFVTVCVVTVSVYIKCRNIKYFLAGVLL